MRISNSLFYTNSINDYQKNQQELYKVNQQMSGKKIQNSFEDSSVYVDTMRLNYEVATLEQTKESSSKAQSYAKNTDQTLNEFTESLTQFKNKLIQASNGGQSTSSLNAIANELQALKGDLMNLSNTSINGQYLFSGSAVDTKPIDINGNYNGNDGSVEALISSGVTLPYNISGQDLFLGADGDYNKTLSTNVKMLNQSKLHPNEMLGNGDVSLEEYLTENDTIRDMVGDTDTDSTNDPNSVFYVSGRKSDGTTFSSQIEVSSTSKVSDLLEKIGQEYGNTTTNTVVDVSLNAHGQIEIKDLKDGNSLLEMNIFGAVDRDAAAGTAGNADVGAAGDIDDLLADPNVDIIEFSKSNFTTTNSANTIVQREDTYNPGLFRVGYPLKNTDGSDVVATDTLNSFMPAGVVDVNVNGTIILVTGTVQDLLSTIEATQVPPLVAGSARLENGQIIVDDATGNLTATLIARDAASNPAAVGGFSVPDTMNYERRGFTKDGNKLTSNISQVVKSTNEYATSNTKLIDVAGIKTFDDISVAGDETTFELNGVDNQGNAFSAEIELTNDPLTGARFTLDGGATYYNVYDADGNRTMADDVTYKQLTDVVSLITSNNIPAATNTPADYESAISSASGAVEVNLDYKGRLEIYDKFNSESPIEFSMYDDNSDNATTSSSLSFMANDMISIEEPTIDFFKDLDEMIEAVRSGTFRMDSESGDPRNIGMQNSLLKIDHLMEHVTNEHTKIGSYSNALTYANERSTLLSVNVQTIRSEVIDTDVGEAYMKFQQLANSYQAMLSTVTKINSMSLLNYM
ncbi:flagellar hook-associated protein FlgL [Sulfurospirillum arcachonense]|uniref:flagellar hook-associated protein FlgL n=1 Tax=Sulfurospirillum arcachonense TaxID=57666 RepID=UPI0004688AF5|nr:flagellar hook-associated protein FlgL [Sulfurospirillum arcachonense]